MKKLKLFEEYFVKMVNESKDELWHQLGYFTICYNFNIIDKDNGDWVVVDESLSKSYRIIDKFMNEKLNDSIVSIISNTFNQFRIFRNIQTESHIRILLAVGKKGYEIDIIYTSTEDDWWWLNIDGYDYKCDSKEGLLDCISFILKGISLDSKIKINENKMINESSKEKLWKKLYRPFKIVDNLIKLENDDSFNRISDEYESSTFNSVVMNSIQKIFKNEDVNIFSEKKKYHYEITISHLDEDWDEKDFYNLGYEIDILYTSTVDDWWWIFIDGDCYRCDSKEGLLDCINVQLKSMMCISDDVVINEG